MDLRLSRPISSTSSNPSVVKMASLAPALCTTTLVARVVPSTIRSTPSGWRSRRPRILLTPLITLSTMWA